MIASALVAIALGSPTVLPVADPIPDYDVTPVCRAAITVMPGSFEACMKDEQAARAQLTASWDRFAVPQRASCMLTESTGGTPSYVELLTCLQMAQDAQSLPESRTDGSNR
jgi:hypothetical protein